MSGNKRQKQKIQVNYVFQLSTGSPNPRFICPPPAITLLPSAINGTGKVTRLLLGGELQFGIEIELMLGA